MSNKINTAVGTTIITIMLVTIMVFTNILMKQLDKIAQIQIPIPTAIQKEIDQNKANLADTQPTNPSQSNTDIQGWKTYKNDEYKFEFQYPSNLILKDDALWTKEDYNGHFVDIKGDRGGWFTPEISFSKYFKENTTIDAAIKDSFPSGIVDLGEKKIIKIGLNFFISINGYEGGCQYLIENSTSIVQFFADCDYKSGVANQILSTFKFTN